MGMSHSNDESSHSTPEPDHLLEQWQSQNDNDALEELLRIEVALLKARIQKRGHRMMRPSHGASDVAQEAVMGLLRCRQQPRFENPKALRSYLWKAAWRLLLRRLKKPGVRAVPLQPNSSWAIGKGLETTGGMGSIDRAERAVALDLALTLLQETDRSILELVYFRGLEVQQAAETLEITRAAADMRLYRARKNLAKKLIDWNEIIG